MNVLPSSRKSRFVCGLVRMFHRVHSSFVTSLVMWFLLTTMANKDTLVGSYGIISFKIPQSRFLPERERPEGRRNPNIFLQSGLACRICDWKCLQAVFTVGSTHLHNTINAIHICQLLRNEYNTTRQQYEMSRNEQEWRESQTPSDRKRWVSLCRKSTVLPYHRVISNNADNSHV